MSNVTNMSCMFYWSSSFNQDVSEWNMSQVANMKYVDVELVSHMFHDASSFNQDYSGWYVRHAAPAFCQMMD